MGKKSGWFRAVKKVISCGSGQNSRKKNRKSREWVEEVLDLDSSMVENAAVVPAAHTPVQEATLMEAENEQTRHAYSVALATAAAAEAAVAAAHAAAEVVRLTATARSSGRTKEEIAAIKIQTAFRGYLARRALKALRGLARLKSLIEGQSVKRQAANTSKHMQVLTRMQSEVRARRTTKSENLAIHHQIRQKHEKELEKLRASIGENWDHSMQSKEQIEANLHQRQEAATKRERALAYAYTHQQTWRASSNTANQTFMDPTNPHWGWSWLERWMAARPYENGNAEHKEQNSDRNSVKSPNCSTSRSVSVRGDPKLQSPTAKNQSRPSSRHSPSTPKSKVTPVKFRPPSPRGTNGTDDDSKSIRSVQSDRCRRHSIAGSSVRDDESLTSSPAASHDYMASTVSTRAKSRLPSPLGGERGASPVGGSAKKRLSFSGSPRRNSGAPKTDDSPMKDINTNS